MRIIEGARVRAILTPETCIPLMRDALTGLESGTYAQPMRLITVLPNTAKFGFMPAYVGDYFGAKVISAYAPNEGTGYPSHVGYVMLFESAHSTAVAMVEAGTITELRTGAVSALATALLARADAHTIAFVGAGAQARSHMAAISTVRRITSVSVFDIRPEASARFKADVEARYGVEVSVCASVADAVRDADIICTVSPGKEPVLFKGMVKPGAHINAVGTFSPTTREVGSDLVAAARLYSDFTPSLVMESGEYLIPLREGLIGADHVIGSIGQLAMGQVEGRGSDHEITLFDALGLAVEDVVCAKYVYDRGEGA